MSSAAEAQAGEDLVILPGEVTLRGPQSRQRLVLERVVDGRHLGELTEGVVWTSSDERIARVEDSTVLPGADGQATITASVDGRSASLLVTVEATDAPFTWSFANHVESVLSKAGCNSGACHGAQAGKNGFRLSLRGFDRMGDFQSLTRHARGRRIVSTDPGRSLLLTKPTGAIPHKGGVRFHVDSIEYRVLAEWIAAGTPPPTADDPVLQRLEMLPAGMVLAPGARQSLLVRAHFSDGHTEDVTRWAKYTATDQSVAEVDEAGQVTIVGHGEGAITAWYLSQVVSVSVSVPYGGQVDPAVFAAAPRRNVIDELVLEKLADLNLPPSPRADDGALLRRAYLDTIGVLPTVEETRAFLADDDPHKRDRLIDALLARSEWVDYWTYKWSDLLLVNSEKLSPPAMWAYSNWIRNHVAAGTPWDEMVRDLVTATGSTLENGATNFFILHSDPADVAETVSQAFMGLSIGCAKCHNHPLEKWTNSQYFAMANLFARVRAKNAAGEGNQVVFAANEGDLIQPLTGRPQPPSPLDGEPLALDDPSDRRVALAEWLTSPENPYFTRAVVNRVWANFMGVGLVENVDDLRVTNPPSNAPLLEALAEYLIEHEYDLKALMRLILESEAYQRSSLSLAENESDARFYSRYYTRRLMAEVLLDAVSQVTGVPSEFAEYPSGWRALELPDSNVGSYFLRTFGRPERVITCECERGSEPTMVQVLHLSNGGSINDKLAHAESHLARRLAEGATADEIIDEVYLSALCRLPLQSERAAILAVLAETPPEELRAAWEDVYWSVLSSKEFLFNH